MRSSLPEAMITPSRIASASVVVPRPSIVVMRPWWTIKSGTAAAGSGSESSARMSTATPAATTSAHAPRTSHLPIGLLHPPARPRGEPAAGSAGSIS